jgi:UDP-glucose:(heptosyl)LPS alpha-1,3-glucosyltransferase
MKRPTGACGKFLNYSGKMKIAYFTHIYGGHKGGIERVVQTLAETFSPEHEVHVFAQRIHRNGDDASIKFHRMPVFTSKKLVNLLLFFISGKFMLAGKRFDIVHIHNAAWYKDAVVTCHGVARSYIELINNLDSQYKKEVSKKEIIRLKLLSPLWDFNFMPANHRKIIAVSGGIKKNLVKHCGVEPDEISLIPNGVDPDNFTRYDKEKCREEIRNKYGIQKDNVVFLFVGSHDKVKGLLPLLHAFSRLEGTSARLIIVGEDKHLIASYRDKVKELDLENKVFFAGAQKEVARFYHAADAFVLPSFHEGSSLALLEAMACGLPVLVTDTGGAEELVRDGVNGFVVPAPPRIDDLEKNLRKILDKKERLADMGAESLAVAQNYTWERITEMTMELYKQNLSGK